MVVLLVGLGSAVYASSAYDPTPEDGADDVSRTPTLNWTAGDFASQHDVYFGTDNTAVENATTSSPEYKPPRLALGTTNYYPGLLELDTHYYWRIDEVNASGIAEWPGLVWDFKTANYVVVDDFDSYANTTELRAVWKDYWTNGTGAEVFVESDANFTEDGNSMEYKYDSSIDPYYSEAYADMTDLGIDSNWTSNDIEVLTLSFMGKIGNALEDMYVVLRDGSNVTAKVIYPDVNELAQEWKGFQEWNIELSEFVLANSVDLTDIQRITIGFGDKTSGGSGTVWFDNIRLYPPRCVPEMTGIDVLRGLGDIGGGEGGAQDCNTDYLDLEIMVAEWLTVGIKADIVDNNNVDFGDYRILANHWLEELPLWP